MLKLTLKTLTIIITGLAISSCVSNEAKTRGHAEKLCDCMETIGLDESITASDLNDRKKRRKMEKDMERKLPACVLPVLKEMESEMSEMGKTEKKEYTKAFLKNVIDTDCADAVLNTLPYDMLGMIVDEVEREAKYSERRMNQDIATELEESDD